MAFPFRHVCDLLQQVADLPPARRAQPHVVAAVVKAWFRQHRQAVDALIAAAALVGSEASTSASVSAPASTLASASASASASALTPSRASSPSSAAAALLSTLLPGHRPDRVYALQARGLQRILVRVLGLGSSRAAELARWMRPCEHASVGTGPVDLADCIEVILTRTPNPCDPDAPPVTVEEVDAVLHAIAARCRFSGPTVRAADKTMSEPAAAATTRDALGPLYRRLDARDAKWLTRLILRDFRPVVLEAGVVVRAFHPTLPRALQVHADLEAAVRAVAGIGGGGGSSSGDGSTGSGLTASLRPVLGVKVGRQAWAKARSIEHCLRMGGPQRVSCERKMDGEYVQVHVDLSRGHDRCLQLFSKSGKDSTWDRENLHSAIRESLRIGQRDCKVQRGCILEGEMLAYDERAGQIMDFDAIRKHVNRSGSMIYVNRRTETQDYEHLMIVYYDLLLVDDESLLTVPQADRFRRLEDLVTCRPGSAEIVQREVIDFGRPTAAARLRQAFARCIVARLEGLVVKPERDTYFDFAPTPRHGAPSSPWVWPRLTSHVIKLKKEYIGAFGEVGDFSVVGGRYDAAKAMEYPADLPGLRWTHFFVGCLDTATKTTARPRFVVTNVVTLTVTQMATFLKYCRPRVVPVLRARGRGPRRRRVALSDARGGGDMLTVEPDTVVGENGDNGDNGGGTGDDVRAPFDLAPLDPGLDGCRGGPTELFADPPVVDMRCFAFHRPGFGRFWSPRFPSVVKFHFDRTYRDALTFDELQAMAVAEAKRRAEAADAEAADDESDRGSEVDDSIDEERARWVAQLKRADRRGIAVDAETSQSSAAATASTARSQSSGPRGPGTETALVSMPAMGAAPIETIAEEPDDGEGGMGEAAETASQLSIATVTYTPEPENKTPRAVAATVIDLTADSDDEDEDDTAKGKDSRREDDDDSSDEIDLVGILRRASTPQPSRPSSSLVSGATLATLAMLTSPATVMASSSFSVDDDDVVSTQGPPADVGQASSTRGSPGACANGKRRRQWEEDARRMAQLLSPPQLKRARSGI